MNRLSLTAFVDIVLKTGTPKATVVSQVKSQLATGYDPRTDYYKAFRESVVSVHQNNQPKSAITALISTVTDSKKLGNYKIAKDGYLKWWGRKQFVWFTPPKEDYEKGGIQINVNPELGLVVDGVNRYIVKLYLKADKLSKQRADLITGLMEIAFRSQCKNEIMAVLDVRNGKLFEGKATSPLLKATIDAEIAYISSIWPYL